MKIKYSHSWHLPYSEKMTKGDTKHSSDDHFHNKMVVVSIKMDGECTSIYDAISHARSLDSKIDSEDRRWIEAFRQNKIEGNISDTMRICGENLFYKHTCYYDDLESFFYCFSIWEDKKCLSWNETKEWCELLDIKTVPIIYEGVYDKNRILIEFNKYIKENKDVEGFVVRIQDEFYIEEFSFSLSKYVRETFEIPPQHWRHSKKTNNLLKNNENPWNIL